MLTIIISILFILSICGIAFILYRKIQALRELPVNGKIEFVTPKFVSNLEIGIKKFLAVFQKHILLHKFLFSVKCIISKVEHRIDNWLHHIRKKAQQKNK